MSFCNILIIETDLDFTRNLNHSLKQLGFNTILKIDVEDPEEIQEIKIPIHSIILNLELRNIEGLTLYSYLKKSKQFRNTTFSFLAESEETFALLDNMTLERAVFLNKKGDYDELLRQIVNNVSLPQDFKTEQQYILENTGNTSDISVREILTYCENTNFTGNLILLKEKDFGIFKIYLGQIEEVRFKNYDRKQAIEVLANWRDVEFRLERYRFSVSEMKKLSVKSLDNTNGDTNAENFIDYSDLFIDILCFLYAFLQQQLGKDKASEIIQFQVDKYYQDHSKPKIVFCSDNDDTFTFEDKVDENHIGILIYFIKSIIEQAQMVEPLIEYEDFLEFIHELDPYLNQIHFTERLRAAKAPQVINS